MSKNLLALDAAIRAVCPIDGCCSDGTIWFTEHTTDAQKAAAHKIMQEFPESEANEIDFRGVTLRV
jgi:hypothetical protein